MDYQSKNPQCAISQPGLLQPFTFSKVTCSNEFGHKALKAFLVERGLYNKGLWKQLCGRTMSKGQQFGLLHRSQNKFEMPEESSILDLPISDIPHLDQPLKNWQQYYKLRQFGLDSPISGLLEYPLTEYWIITSYLPQLYPKTFERMKQCHKITIHLIGVEKEADMFPAFLEFARLLLPVKVDMHLFGNEIAFQANGLNEHQENLHFKLHSCLYHESDFKQLKPPDVVIGFNAGLGAYPSFLDTVRLILADKTPFFCTDYCYESVIHSKKTVEEFTLGDVVNVVQNPFHGPFRTPIPELASFCFSNAYIFTIKEK